jgi:small subunit ribosomal protein S21
MADAPGKALAPMRHSGAAPDRRVAPSTAARKPFTGRSGCDRNPASGDKSIGRQPLTEGGAALVQVVVRDNNVDQALRALKKKMQREGIFREMKLRRSYEKPSERKARERAEAVRRARKLARKRAEREGLT